MVVNTYKIFNLLKILECFEILARCIFLLKTNVLYLAVIWFHLKSILSPWYNWEFRIVRGMCSIANDDAAVGTSQVDRRYQVYKILTYLFDTVLAYIVNKILKVRV